MIICFCFVILSNTNNFIAYYCSIMIISAYLINYVLDKKIKKTFPIAFLGSVFFVYFTHLTRVGFFLEILFVVSFIICIIELSRVFPIPSLKFSMLEFYIMQAITCYCYCAFKFGGFSTFDDNSHYIWCLICSRKIENCWPVTKIALPLSREQYFFYCLLC